MVGVLLLAAFTVFAPQKSGVNIGDLAGLWLTGNSLQRTLQEIEPQAAKKHAEGPTVFVAAMLGAVDQPAIRIYPDGRFLYFRGTPWTGTVQIKGSKIVFLPERVMGRTSAEWSRQPKKMPPRDLRRMMSPFTATIAENGKSLKIARPPSIEGKKVGQRVSLKRVVQTSEHLRNTVSVAEAKYVGFWSPINPETKERNEDQAFLSGLLEKANTECNLLELRQDNTFVNYGFLGFLLLALLIRRAFLSFWRSPSLGFRCQKG